MEHAIKYFQIYVKGWSLQLLSNHDSDPIIVHFWRLSVIKNLFIVFL